MKIDNQIDIKIFDLPLWSAPFGQVLLDNIDYNSKVERILDIGFGGGFPLLELSNRFCNSKQVYGIDINETVVNQMNVKIQDNDISNVTVVQGDAEKLPFEKMFFDLIVSNNGINNVDNIEKVIFECSRVCNINGEFVFTFNLNDTYSDFYKILIKILKDLNLSKEIDKIEKHIDKKRPQLEKVEGYLEKANFEILKIKDEKFNMSFSNGTTFFNHYFIKNFFLPEWKNIFIDEKRGKIFSKLENELNSISKNHYLKFGVPFVCIKCKKGDK